MGVSAILVAGAPLVAALAALLATYLTGFDQNANLPVELESRFYGFFLDRYPLYAFAIVYGVTRVLAAALAPGPASVPRRIFGGLLGTVLVLGLSLHPTFGGVVLRGTFMTGGVAFLNQVPLPVAYALGAAVAAAIFGGAMGFGALVANPGWHEPAGRWRALSRGAAGMLSRYLLLWYAFAVLGLARAAGFGPWPLRPLDLGDTLLAAAGLILALLPHALVVAGRTERKPD